MHDIVVHNRHLAVKRKMHYIVMQGLTNPPPHRGEKMTKTANLALRLPPELKAALEEASRADARSVSNYVELVLTNHLREKGLLPKAA